MKDVICLKRNDEFSMRKLYEAICEKLFDSGRLDIERVDDHEEVKFTWILKEQPEIVRCKDCKFYPDGDGAMCWTPCQEIITQKYWFCANAEKKQS